MKAYDYDMIDRYLEGLLSDEELKAFEREMNNDPSLKAEVELYRDVHQTLRLKLYPGEEESAFRDTLEGMRGNYFTGAGAKVIRMKKFRWISAVAASIVIIAVAVTIWSPWKKDLYEQYAYVEMPGVNERGSNTDSLLQQAATDFNRKDYGASLPLFEQVLVKDSTNSLAKFYYGVALMQSGQLEKSRSAFIQLFQGVSVYRYDAAFYIALSYLKENNRDACREWLNKIPADASIYNKSHDLLKKL